MKKILIGYPLNRYREFEGIIGSLSDIYEMMFKDYDHAWLKQNLHRFDILVPNLKTVIDDEILKRAKRLELIFTPSTGSDHIKIKNNMRNIQILTLNDFKDEISSINSTAELAFSLILALSRKLCLAHKDVIRAGKWERNKFIGKELSDKNLGLIGMGRVGRQAASYGKAFGMKVVYWDKVKYKNYTRIGELRKLLAFCDYIILSISLNGRTHHLINMKNVRSIKRGALLANVSRGKVIEEKALCYALDKGILSGVAADVLELELENHKRSPLYKYARKHPRANIIITPHIGGATIDAWKKVFSLVFREVKKRYDQN